MLSCQRDRGSLGPTVAGPFWKTGDGRKNLVVTQLALHRVEGHAAPGGPGRRTERRELWLRSLVVRLSYDPRSILPFFCGLIIFI